MHLQALYDTQGMLHMAVEQRAKYLKWGSIKGVAKSPLGSTILVDTRRGRGSIFVMDTPQRVVTPLCRHRPQ